MNTERDIAAKQGQLRSLIAARKAQEAARRAKLWQEAYTSRRAGRRLRKELEADLKSNDEIRRRSPMFTGDPETLQQLDNDRRDIERQLHRLDTLMHQLGS